MLVGQGLNVFIIKIQTRHQHKGHAYKQVDACLQLAFLHEVSLACKQIQLTYLLP